MAISAHRAHGKRSHHQQGDREFCWWGRNVSLIARERLGAPADVQAALIIEQRGDGDVCVCEGEDGGELFAPLDEHERFGIGGHLVEAKGGELALGFEAVEIEMEDGGEGADVLVDEGEGGAGDVILTGGVEGGGPAFDQGGFAGAELAAQDDDAGGGEDLCDGGGDGEGAGEGAGLEALFAVEAGDVSHGLLTPGGLAEAAEPGEAVFIDVAVAEGGGEVGDDVGGEDGFFVEGLDGEVGGEAVQVDGGFYGFGYVVRILGEHGGDDAGEDVAAAAFGQGGVAGGVDGDAAIGVGDQGAPALEDEGDGVLGGEGAGEIDAVGFDLGDGEAEEAGHLAGVRGQDEGAVDGRRARRRGRSRRSKALRPSASRTSGKGGALATSARGRRRRLRRGWRGRGRGR